MKIKDPSFETIHLFFFLTIIKNKKTKLCNFYQAANIKEKNNRKNSFPENYVARCCNGCFIVYHKICQ